MKRIRHILLMILCFCIFAFGTADLMPKASAASILSASEDCVEFIKGVEGFSPQPYYDYNQYTVGYGTKCPTEKYFEYTANGIPKKEADALLREHVAEIGKTINEKLINKYNITLTQHQFDALVSFSFNIGTGWLTYDSTLRNAILRNADDNDLVYAFSLYCTAGGKYLPGLVTRRLCEANIYLNGLYSQKLSDTYGYVYYDANGGTLTYRVQGFVCDNGSAPAANAVRSGDVFLGWYTNPTGGSLVTQLDRHLSGRTLFARWQSAENPDVQDSASTTVRVTGDIVNIRSGPGTNYEILRKAYRNDVLTVSHVTNLTNMRWGNIQDGWICLDYTNYDDVINGFSAPDNNETETPSEQPTVPENDTASDIPDTEDSAENQNVILGTVRVNDALRIRSGPGTNYTTVGFLFNDRRVEILELETVDSMTWGRITNGWISMDYIVTDLPYIDSTPDTEPEESLETKPSQKEPEQENTESVGETDSAAITGTIKADALRIRTGAGTENPIVGFYYQNETVTIFEKVQVGPVYWGKTDRGWINMDYVVIAPTVDPAPQPVVGRTMTVIADCLRVRKSTGTDYKISELLYYGDTVVVYETVTVDEVVWGKVDSGWICMDYVA